MKYVSLFLFLISFSAAAQVKDDNTIVIKSTQTDLYKKAGMVLVQNGFAIKNANEAFQTINTEWKIMSANGSYRLDMVILENEIRLKGFFKNDLTNAMFNTQSQDRQVIYRKRGPLNTMWTMVHNIADEFEGEVSYLVQ